MKMQVSNMFFFLFQLATDDELDNDAVAALLQL